MIHRLKTDRRTLLKNSALLTLAGGVLAACDDTGNGSADSSDAARHQVAMARLTLTR
jgi:hypothetical protein